MVTPKLSCIFSLISIVLLLMFPDFVLIASAQINRGGVSALAWNIDGTRLAIGYELGLVEVVNTETGESVFTDTSLRQVSSLDWSRLNPNYLAVGGDVGSLKGTVVVIDAIAGRTIYSLDGGDSVSSIAWSPDGSKIAAASNIAGIPITSRNEIRIWNADSGELLTHAMYSVGPIGSIAWSPDSQRIAGATTDHTVLIWNVTTGEVITTLLGHLDVVLSVTWSPDGNRLASTGSILDNTIRIWNVASGENVATYSSRYGVVKWSPEGSQLAVGENHSLRVLDANSGQELTVLTTNELDNVVAYSPYGGRLAFGGRQSQSEASTASDIIAQNLTSIAGGSVHILVPTPSLERLQAIADACNAPADVERVLPASTAADQLAEFVAQVEALSESAIPSACRADLIAVAEALQSR